MKTVQPRKKRGPPPTGKGTAVQVRVQPELLAAIDKWIEDENRQIGARKISRPEGVRRLVIEALQKMGLLAVLDTDRGA